MIPKEPVTTVEIDGMEFQFGPVDRAVLESGRVVPAAIALSLRKPPEWAWAFFLANPPLGMKLWAVISGISGFHDD